MVKKYFLILLLLFSNFLFANTIQLPDNYKLKSTLSGKLSQDLSLHLIFSINKLNKLHTIHPYIFDGKTIKKLALIENKKEIEIVSFHKNNNILVLFFRPKSSEKKLIKTTINITNNKVLKDPVKPHSDFFGSFEEEGVSTLLYKNKKKLTINQYRGNKENSFVYHFKNHKDPLNLFFKSKGLSSIKTDQFVIDGSTKKRKIYINDDTLILTWDKYKELKTEVTELLLNRKNTSLDKINYTIKKEDSISYKKMATFYSDEHLYQLALNKNQGIIQIVDAKNKGIINKIVIDSTLNLKIKGNKNFEGIKSFLKNSSLRWYTPTITINKSINDTYRIRLNYVDFQNININRHWWFFQQQERLWKLHQKDFIQNTPPLHGPSQPDEFAFNYARTQVNKRFFELLIDKNGVLLNQKLFKPIYPKINKNIPAERLRNNKDFSMKSYCFINKDFRYMVYSKKTNTIQLFNDKL